MPPDRSTIGSPDDWLKRARSNLARARLPKLDEALWEDYCFDAQQAAEKALKALLLFNNIPFRFVHDIAELLTLLEQNGFELPEEIRAGAELSNYAVEARYPSPMEPVTEQEYEEAISISKIIVSWVTKIILKKEINNH
jgi:HEPN domain-containing protein